MYVIEKKAIVDTIIRVVNTQSGGVNFLYGYGGNGKTFVWKTLMIIISIVYCWVVE